MIDKNLLNKAIILTQKGDLKEAKILYDKLLSKYPDDDILLSAVGLFYVTIKDYSKAEIYLRQACQTRKTLGTVSALGFAEFEMRNYKDAATTLEAALEFGENEDIYHKLITSLFQIKNYQKAIKYSEEMYSKYPQNSNAATNMVKSLTNSGKMLEAEKMSIDYLKSHPDTASMWTHLGFLKELIYCDDKQACECYKAAAELGYLEADYNIAVSYYKQKEYKLAEDYYKKMLENFPNDEETVTSLGMCHLTQKHFEEGYKYFYNRDCAANSMTNSLYKIGDNLEEDVIVICDQGFGDHIQFVRYLPILKQKAKNLKVAAHLSLLDLFRKNYPDIEFIKYSEINPDIQSIRITDLAYVLGMDFDNIPYREGYLTSEPANINSDKLKVGLCWEAGAAGIRTMINRTININLLEPFLNLDNVQIYSLQVQDTLHGNEKYPQMINLIKNIKTFEDTASIIKGLDLVISVDTAVAHLAGAMGVKTFLMLPYISDWRWFNDTKTTPWYKSIEIFKQDAPISWEKPIGDILCRLKESSL